jgi:hypothetical protein
MPAVNHGIIACVFIEITQTLWPFGAKFDSVLLLVTDATQYVKQTTDEVSVN